MLQRIALSQFELGMFIHSLEGNWFQHSFWRKRFLLDDSAMLARLRDSDVEGVVIDTSRGRSLDAPARSAEGKPGALRFSQTQGRARARLVSPPPSASAAPVSRATAPQPLAREFGMATRVADRSARVVSRAFFEARLGKTIKAGQIARVVDDIFASIQRNPHAFNGLMRCRRDHEAIYRHALAVSGLMIALAREMRLEPEEVRRAGMVGLLIDVGIGLLSLDPAQLGEHRRADPGGAVRDHPRVGHEFLLAGGDIPDDVARACLEHHERIDGTGYPARLPGNQISRLGRMAAICDTYDALANSDEHSGQANPATAIQRLSEARGHLDPVIVHHFIEAIGIYPVGAAVLLRSDRLAMVVDQDPSDHARPLVRAFYSLASAQRIRPLDIALASSGGRDEIMASVDPAAFGIVDFPRLREQLFAGACAAG